MSPHNVKLVFEDWADERERDICKRYWECLPDGSFAHPIKKLAKEAREKANTFDYYVSVRCKAYSERVCNACSATGMGIVEFRKEFEEPQSWFCKACREKRLEEETASAIAERKAAEERREATRKAAEEQEQAQRAQILEYLRLHYPLGEPTNPLSVRLRFAMYWYALIGREQEPWIDGIPPVAKAFPSWIGDAAEEENILRDLLDLGLLYIDHESLLSAQIDSTEDFPMRQIRWQLSSPEHTALARAYVIDSRNVVPDPRAWPTHWRGEYVELFEEMARKECFIYWHYLQRKMELGTYSIDHLTNIINEALAVLSVSQIAWIMWGATQTAKKWCDKKAIREVAPLATRILQRRIRSNLKAPADKKAFERHAQGFATEVALSIMSGTEIPWFKVSMRDVHELLRGVTDDGAD